MFSNKSLKKALRLFSQGKLGKKWSENFHNYYRLVCDLHAKGIKHAA